jgi:hypothetical protein
MVADFSGVSLATVQRAEAGKLIRPDSQLQLCKFFAMNAEQLGLLQTDKSAPNDTSIQTHYNAIITPGSSNISRQPLYLSEVITMEQTITEKLDNAESTILDTHNYYNKLVFILLMMRVTYEHITKNV